MLQVTVRRFRKFWPDAEIFVFNETPELLDLYCPTAKPILPAGRNAFYNTAAVLTRLGRKFKLPFLSELDVNANTADEWAYIYLDPQKYNWDNYTWQMKFRRMTPFQEYAFNFRYVDFDNRYRYRFEDDLLFFDSKISGKWACHGRMPFPMAMGAWYDLRIDTRGDQHRCYVNGMLLMENKQGAIPRGSISIILWEIDNKTDCIADVGPMLVKRLV